MFITKKILKSYLIRLSLIVSLFFVLSGCSDDNNGHGGNDAPAVIQADTGYLLKGDIEAGTTILVPEDAYIFFSGLVKFKAGSTLKIEPGAIFKGDRGSISCIVIERGAKIDAQGTAEKPITFTGVRNEGGIFAGDWGGIIINGKAFINSGAEDIGEQDTEYGGTDDTDNSGIIKYVRVHFGGMQTSATDKISGIALQGVGSGTIIDYVHVHICKGDGFSMSGGAVNLKHVISTGNKAYQFSCKNGWRGSMEFGIGVALSEYYLKDYGRSFGLLMGYENNESNNTAQPVTNVTHYNMTLLFNSASVFIKKGAKAFFYNSLVGAFSVPGTANDNHFVVEDPSSEITYDYCHLAKTKTTGYTLLNSGKVNPGENNQSGNECSEYLNIQINPGSMNNNNLVFYYDTHLREKGVSAFVPVKEITGAINPPDNGFFDPTANFIGAIKDADHNWLEGWVEFPANATAYGGKLISGGF